jgi:hypothetical protein
MDEKKRLIRRYLLGTLVALSWGWLASLPGMSCSASTTGMAVSPTKTTGLDMLHFTFLQRIGMPLKHTFNKLAFLSFLLCDNSAANIFLCSTLLVPFSVYTFDVVAASRRKRVQGGA